MTAARTGMRGFNLLPHRQRDARLARRRRYAEWAGAALCGCIGVSMLMGWQAIERTRVDRQRESIERRLATLAPPLAEHARLISEARSERLQNQRAMTLAEPLVHLLDLLDALSEEPSGAVFLRQMRHRERHTELLAVSADHAASAAWVNRLATLRGVTDSDLSDLRRAANAADSQDAIEITAHLKWDGPPPEKPKASVAAHQKTGGEK
ncbi:fimbrial assembly protein [Paraburkholderia sp. LEh10]|nr:fimbrial assembly protein [Paraburkholderia sp. LEh10]